MSNDVVAIRFNNITFAYGKKIVLDGLNFEIQRGQFTALLGANGAGKSTIFNIITGLVAPDSGQLEIDGQSLVDDGVKARKKMGVVFQESTLDQELTILQNLRYCAGIRGMKYSSDRANDLLKKFQLYDHCNQRIRELSGGYKRRVEVVRALLHSPDILILDEPTVGLDPASKELLTIFAHELALSGVCVFWITHLLDEIYDKDHVILLENGRIKNSGSFVELGGAKEIALAYQRDFRPSL